MSLLRLRGIEASYGPSQALFGVDLEIGEGEAVALMGRNGMGKTTLIRVVCRLLRHSAGDAAFLGRDLAPLRPHEAARLGIGLVPEGRRCFANLSVEENLLAAARPGKWDMARVSTLFPRMAERSTQRAGLLSGGEQQMLSIGRALMTNPRLLLLDEATEGLAPLVRQEIWQAIATLRAEGGVSILIVDKTLDELRKVADRAVIVERGCSVWSGSLDQLGKQTANRYLGV